MIVHTAVQDKGRSSFGTFLHDLAQTLDHNIIRPFVYRRYLDYGVFESLREMKALVAAEVRKREMANNIKLGPGGIRAIEFVVQSLQLVRGGSRPELQCRGLLTVLPLLVGRHGLSEADATDLSEAYCFLRRVEKLRRTPPADDWDGVWQLTKK